jgi:proline iminopeptidase
VGFSYGALLASLYAKDYPQHVESMIFIAPANLLAFPPEDGGIYELVKPLLPDSMKAPYDEYLGRFFDFSTLFHQTDSSLRALNCEFAPYFFAAMRAKGVSILEGITCESIGGWSVQGIYMSMGMSYDHRPALKEITAPVLVLHGEKDIQSEAASRTYSDTYPNATFVTIPDAGHFMWQDNEKAFVKAIGEFLAKK